MKLVPQDVYEYTRWRMKFGTSEEENVFVTEELKSKKEVKKFIYPLVPIFEKLEAGEYDALVIFETGIVFYKDGLCGLLSKEGKEILSREYTEIFIDDSGLNGLSEVTKSEKKGIYSISKEKFIVPVEYEEADLYSDMITVKKSNLWGILDFDGNVIVPIEYDDVWPGNKFTCRVHISKKDDVFFAFDLTGKKLNIKNCRGLYEATCKAKELLNNL